MCERRSGNTNRTAKHFMVGFDSYMFLVSARFRPVGALHRGVPAKHIFNLGHTTSVELGFARFEYEYVRANATG